jgi:hypothetical protein
VYLPTLPLPVLDSAGAFVLSSIPCALPYIATFEPTASTASPPEPPSGHRTRPNMLREDGGGIRSDVAFNLGRSGMPAREAHELNEGSHIIPVDPHEPEPFAPLGPGADGHQGVPSASRNSGSERTELAVGVVAPDSGPCSVHVYLPQPPALPTDRLRPFTPLSFLSLSDVTAPPEPPCGLSPRPYSGCSNVPVTGDADPIPEPPPGLSPRPSLLATHEASLAPSGLLGPIDDEDLVWM